MRLKYVSRLIVCVLCFSCIATVSANEDPIRLRRGISNLFHKATQSEIVFSSCLCDALPSFEGGSVNVRPPYMKRFDVLCREWYPEVRFGLKTHVGSGPPGSVYGAYRYKQVGSGGSFVLIDLAQSDLDKEKSQVVDGLEGMIRKAFSEQDVVFVYAGIPAFVETYLDGKTPDVIAWHEEVAEHYGVPSIDMARNAAQKIRSGEITKEDYFKKNERPPEPGYAVDLALFDRFMETGYRERTSEPERMRRKMPKPISPTNLQSAGFVDYELGDYGTEWQDGVTCLEPISGFRHMLVSTQPGAVFGIDFTGLRCGFIDILAADTADLEYRVDDRPWTNISAESGKELPEPKRRTFLNLVDGLDPRKEHRFEIRIAPNQPASLSPRSARLCTLLIDGKVRDPYAGMAPLEKADAVYGKMRPVEYVPPAGRWKHIPKTMEKLRNGETLKIVLLGDSIMGDTGSSQFDLVLQRMYPKCKIEKIMSLRGATGCWYYKENNRVEQYVLRHAPDLLIIGGISNRGDTESVRAVIRQVREKQSPEIMLLTPVFGSGKNPHLLNWTFEIADNPEDERYKLRQLAQDEDCELVDLTGVVVKYMRDSGRCDGWFMRDAVHANQRGFQIIGRHLVEYFRSNGETETANANQHD